MTWTAQLRCLVSGFAASRKIGAVLTSVNCQKQEVLTEVLEFFKASVATDHTPFNQSHIRKTSGHLSL